MRDKLYWDCPYCAAGTESEGRDESSRLAVAAFIQEHEATHHTPHPPCAIFDVDGTLADVAPIRHYITADALRKNFEKFHGASIFVHPHEPIAELAQTLHRAGIAIVVVTARMDRWRYVTSTWLRKWEIDHAELLMRPDGDGRKDVEIKREILTDIRTRFTPVLAVDDNPAIVALWNEERIPVVTWPGWDHDRLDTPKDGARRNRMTTL